MVLNTEVTPELEAEGLARDMVRAIQQARKDAGLNVSDRIRTTVTASQDVLDALLANAELVKTETLTVELDTVPADVKEPRRSAVAKKVRGLSHDRRILRRKRLRRAAGPGARKTRWSRGWPRCTGPWTSWGSRNKAFPIIHVTGTNGKTSTARMIEAGLRAHGLSTGRYTSPHLSKVTERISIDGAPVPDETFVRIWDEIRPYLQIVDGELEAEGQPRLTYFECLTILGFAVFADQPVNVAVIEVGLGGITDATNVGDGQVAVVTPISLDHTDLLGDTTEDIAYEKAGIIKPGGFLISAAQPVDAAQVLLEKAKEVARPVPLRGRGIRRRIPDRRRRRPDGHHPGHRRPLRGPAGAPARRAPGARTPPSPLPRSRPSSAAKRRSTPKSCRRPSPPSPPRAGSKWSAPRPPSSWTPRTTRKASGFRPRPSTRPSASPSSWSVVGVLREKDAEEILRQLKESLGGLAAEYCFTQSNYRRGIGADGDLLSDRVVVGPEATHR